MVFLHKLKKTIIGMRGMSEMASGILRGALLISCAMLLGAWAILAEIGGPGLEALDMYYLAVELYRVPAGILFIAVIAAACIEEKLQK